MKFKTFTLTLVAALIATLSFAQSANNLPAKKLMPTSRSMAAKFGTTLPASPAFRAPRKAATLVTVPATATIETWVVDQSSSAFYNYTGSSWSNYTSKVPTLNVAFDGTDVYIQGLAYWFKEAWIVGKLSGNTVTFPATTFVGEDQYGTELLVGSSDGEAVEDFTFTYDANAKTLTLGATYYIIEADEDFSEGIISYTYWDKLTLGANFEAPEAPTTVEVPANLQTEEYLFTALDVAWDDDNNIVTEDYSTSVQLGIDGTDVYIQGLCGYLPEAWVKGTLSGNTLTLPAGQYFGSYFGYDLFLCGYNGSFTDLVLNYDASTDTYSTDLWLTINGSATELAPYVFYGDVVITKASNGINGVALNQPRNAAIYDLQGRRVTESHLGKGIYISNGKKFVVK